MQFQSKQRIPSSDGGVVVFNVDRLAAHVERALEIDVGRGGIPLVVSITFVPDYPGVGLIPVDVQDAARMTVYATDRSTQRMADYRYQEDVNFPDLNEGIASPSTTTAITIAASTTVSTTTATTKADVRHQRATMKEVVVPPAATVLQFANAQGILYLGLFAYAPLARVTLTCYGGAAHVPAPVTPYEDMASVWRICRMYNVTPENFAAVVEWLRKQRTALILHTVELSKPDTNETVLHVLCGAAGDPRLAKLFAVNCTRFVNVDQEATDGSTALHRLLSIPGICNPANPRYFRALELIDLLVTGCGAALDKQDPNGMTTIHLACRGHRLDSQVLPKLLAAGGKLFASIRDHAGRTALDAAMDPSAGLLPSEVAQVERLLARPPCPLATRTLPGIDRLPDVTVDGSSAAKSELRTMPDAVDRGSKGRPPMLNRAALVAEFKRLDIDGKGWLTLGECKRCYQQYDHYGVVTTDVELDMLIESLGIASDGKITFDEFVLLVLKMTRR